MALFNEDYGLGLCLQCTGEYKQKIQTGGTPAEAPHYACCFAPCPVGVIAVCYDHITVNAAPPVTNGIVPANIIPDLSQMQRPRR
jgi:hypothetical protein